MEVILTHLFSAILQVIIFSIPLLILYLTQKNTQGSFIKLSGLYGCDMKSIINIIFFTGILFLSAIFIFISDDTLLDVITSPPSIPSILKELSINSSSILILLFTAWIKTSLAEELLFRSFFGKLFIKIWGFRFGNSVQALLFGCMHLFLFGSLTMVSNSFLLFIFILTAVVGWLLGFITEKRANGSILPAWLIHGTVNTISYYIFAFVI